MAEPVLSFLFEVSVKSGVALPDPYAQVNHLVILLIILSTLILPKGIGTLSSI